MRYHAALMRMVIKKKKRKTTNVGKDVDKLEPLCITGGNVKWCRPYGKQFSGSSVVKHRTPRWSSSSAPRCIPKGTESWGMNRYWYAIIQNSQKIEAIQVFIMVEWVDQLWYVQTMEYYLAIIKNKLDTCYSMDDSWICYTKWSMPDTKGQIYNSTHMM